ncbi:MAG: hypothetical protein K9N11_09950 [Lentisphaeria bacterium]|nr:hypothetical protein [Lentisphaeria bacterium]
MQTRFLHYVISMMMYVGALAAALFGEINLALLILAVGLILWFIVLGIGDLTDAKRISGMQLLIWGVAFATLCLLFLDPADDSTLIQITTTGLAVGLGVFIFSLVFAILFWHQADLDDDARLQEEELRGMQSQLETLQKRLDRQERLIHGD